MNVDDLQQMIDADNLSVDSARTIIRLAYLKGQQSRQIGGVEVMGTKGWKAECLGSEGYQVRYNHDGLTATQYPKDERYPVVERMGGSFERQKENAHLIAAAPELKTALKDLLGRLSKLTMELYVSSSGLSSPEYDRMRNIYQQIDDLSQDDKSIKALAKVDGGK